jgi:hypothetical protein
LVEIWSWTDALSPFLRNTRAEFPDKIKIFKLDQWYYSIIFLKGGAYYIDGKTVTVITRSCDRLNLTDTAFGDAQSQSAF